MPARSQAAPVLTGCASPGALVPAGEAAVAVEAGGPVARTAHSPSLAPLLLKRYVPVKLYVKSHLAPHPLASPEPWPVSVELFALRLIVTLP